MLILALAENPSLEELINEAAQSKNWPMLIAALLVVVIPAAMKIAGKQVPILDSALTFAKKYLPLLRKPEVPPAPEGEKEGLAKVIPIEEKKP
jgi:hypothetical protein